MRDAFEPEGGDVLDIGCGLGDTTLRLAGMVGPQGSAHGVDVADRMIDIARSDAEKAGVENVSFEAADVQATEFDRKFDHAFSRMGTMFFAAPVPALRNVREALNPGAKLCMVVWRQKIDNEWLHRAALAREGDVILHDRREARDGAHPQVVAIGEATRDDDGVDVLQAPVGVPEQHRLSYPRGGELRVDVVARPREADDAELHAAAGSPATIS